MLLVILASDFCDDYLFHKRFLYVFLDSPLHV